MSRNVRLLVVSGTHGLREKMDATVDNVHAHKAADESSLLRGATWWGRQARGHSFFPVLGSLNESTQLHSSDCGGRAMR